MAGCTELARGDARVVGSTQAFAGVSPLSPPLVLPLVVALALLALALLARERSGGFRGSPFSTFDVVIASTSTARGSFARGVRFFGRSRWFLLAVASTARSLDDSTRPSMRIGFAPVPARRAKEQFHGRSTKQEVSFEAWHAPCPLRVEHAGHGDRANHRRAAPSPPHQPDRFLPRAQGAQNQGRRLRPGALGVAEGPRPIVPSCLSPRFCDAPQPR